MYTTYRGYFKDGRFISSELIAIPENVEVYITIINDISNEIFPVKTKAQRQNEALKRFFTAIDAIADEPITDEDIAVLENNRVNFRRELGI